jgi:hypothetical protein
MIDTILLNISNNKLFSGCVMLLTNIGGKYLSIDLPNNIEKLFSKYFILRLFVLFSIFFMATRDIKSSILLSLLFLIVIKFFLNEKSFFCLIPIENENLNINKKITEDDFLKAKKIINKYYLEQTDNKSA